MGTRGPVEVEQSPSVHGIEEVAVAPRQIALGDRLHVAAGAAAFQPLARLAGSYPGVAIGLGPKLDRKAIGPLLSLMIQSAAATSRSPSQASSVNLMVVADDLAKGLVRLRRFESAIELMVVWMLR